MLAVAVPGARVPAFGGASAVRVAVGIVARQPPSDIATAKINRGSPAQGEPAQWKHQHNTVNDNPSSDISTAEINGGSPAQGEPAQWKHQHNTVGG